MKRFILAIALCSSLLVLLVVFLFPPIMAKENVLIKLLNLPAPPPPNPLANGGMRQRDEKFYDKNNPPKDDAPIEDLIDYWTHQAGDYLGTLSNTRKPSDVTVERLALEMAKKPELAVQLLSVLPENKAAADVIKDIYDNAATEGGVDQDERRQLREWLRFNSPYFSRDLERVSQHIQDINGYVSITDENNLLALSRHDFDKAGPVINQLYNDSSQPVSKVLATWALYRHALETNSLGDIERYRSELMRMVEDRSLSDGVRDKANDALTHEPPFPGLEEWTFSLFEDETLVNMPRYTMLTTLVMYSPPEKFVPRMIALVEKTSNPTVRAAALHNLAVSLARDPNPEMQREIVQCMLPWLEDPKWATENADFRNSRGLIVRKLSEYQIPESVPGLIKVLDEKLVESAPRYGANMANTIGPANIMRFPDTYSLPANVAIAANAAKGSVKDGPPTTSYPYRSLAINALAKQRDVRAAPALRRILNEADRYETGQVVKAILECGGFSVPEQMEALEAVVKRRPDEVYPNAVNVAPANFARIPYPTSYLTSANFAIDGRNHQITPAEVSSMLGQQLAMSAEISDTLARAIVDRIDVLDEKDPGLAASYRGLILKWQNPVFNVLLLHDLKRDAADPNTIVRLLSQRKELRENHAADVFDLQKGKPVAVGVAACLVEDAAGFETILDSADADTKTAMLACARLIRVPLPLAKVAENLKAKPEILQIAAERYLEAEDSPEARAIVLARHPNEAKILGATTAFFVDGGEENNQYLWMLYQSMGDNALYNGWGEGSGNDEELKTVEKRLQEEVKKDVDLIGVYEYANNYIRIYKDRVIFSWDEDESRYRERPLTKYEFEDIKSYLTGNKVDELAPFLTCGGGYCSAKELVMLGRSGGRRVYMNGGAYEGAGSSTPDFFRGLDKYFADLKLTRATLKYSLSREIPGLEILLASDDMHFETVWKNGDDLLVAGSDVAVRKKVQAEIERSYEDAEQNKEEDDPGDANQRARITQARKLRYEGYAWYKVKNGELAGTAAQPPQVEFIPLRDALAVQPTDEQWKARAGEVEIRTSEDGLFKVVHGKPTRIHKGSYQNAVITPNGRWAIVSKADPESGESIVRVDLVTNRQYPVLIQGYGQNYPIAYIATLNKFLVARNDYEYDGEYVQPAVDAAPDDVDPSGMLLVDPATGATQPVAGEFRPLSQQTFRPLQQTAKPNEYWAAIHDPEKNETQLGVYDTKVFGFKPVLRIPKINFNSMRMWVDETGGKVYFVYRGHLLALPLAK